MPQGLAPFAITYIINLTLVVLTWKCMREYHTANNKLQKTRCRRYVSLILVPGSICTMLQSQTSTRVLGFRIASIGLSIAWTLTWIQWWVTLIRNRYKHRATARVSLNLVVIVQACVAGTAMVSKNVLDLTLIMSDDVLNNETVAVFMMVTLFVMAVSLQMTVRATDAEQALHRIKLTPDSMVSLPTRVMMNSQMRDGGSGGGGQKGGSGGVTVSAQTAPVNKQYQNYLMTPRSAITSVAASDKRREKIRPSGHISLGSPKSMVPIFSRRISGSNFASCRRGSASALSDVIDSANHTKVYLPQQVQSSILINNAKHTVMTPPPELHMPRNHGVVQYLQPSSPSPPYPARTIDMSSSK
jgi:hypothetical protein